jgi:hypothetical protein
VPADAKPGFLPRIEKEIDLWPSLEADGEGIVLKDAEHLGKRRRKPVALSSFETERPSRAV